MQLVGGCVSLCAAVKDRMTGNSGSKKARRRIQFHECHDLVPFSTCGPPSNDVTLLSRCETKPDSTLHQFTRKTKLLSKDGYTSDVTAKTL